MLLSKSGRRNIPGVDGEARTIIGIGARGHPDL
jgi:hypothetical protein